MKWGIKVFLLIGLFLLLTGHISVRFYNREWWPFSNYPMYSTPFKPTRINFFEVWAVDPQGLEKKVSVHKRFFPFNERALDEAFRVHTSAEQRRSILVGLLRWAINQADRPPWARLRLYRMEYDFSNPQSLAARSPKELVEFRNQPMSRVLLAEVSHDAIKAN